MAGASKRASRGELLSVASDVAWRYCAYESYGREPTRAVRALKRRCPGFSDRQYRGAFEKSVALYDAVQKLLGEQSALLWAAYEKNEAYHTVFDEELTSRFPGFRKSTLGSMVGMSFYYWHLR